MVLFKYKIWLHKDLRALGKHLLEIVLRKPSFFIITHLVYCILIMLTQIPRIFTFEMVMFLIGSFIGMFFLDIWEDFFNIYPSPFRSIFFQILFSCLALFIVSSSGSSLTIGLVLSVYLHLLLIQIGQLKLKKTLDAWFPSNTHPVNKSTQYGYMTGVFLGMLLLTYLYIK